jgi:4'-phosphopantetheinyl transferase
VVERPPSTDPVEVWRVPLERAPLELADRLRALSDDERARAARFANDRLRADFVMVRSTLRSLLGRRLRQSAASILFEVRPGGKPALLGDSRLRFNVSHSAGLAVIALADAREVGVDVEAWRLPLPDCHDALLAPDEAARVRRAANLAAAFHDHWTLKEAFMKACGRGLTVRPCDVIVTPGIPQHQGGFMLQGLDVGAGYSAAVAVECGAANAPVDVAIRDWAAPPPAAGYLA